MKFLDYRGVKTLWNRINTNFVTKQDLEDTEEVISATLNDLNTRINDATPTYITDSELVSIIQTIDNNVS